MESWSGVNFISFSLTALRCLWTSYGFSRPNGDHQHTWRDNSYYSLSSKSCKTMTTKKRIMNQSYKLELFFVAMPKVALPINIFRTVGVISAGETNHFSSSCHLLCSFIICSNQLPCCPNHLSTVVLWNLKYFFAVNTNLMGIDLLFITECFKVLIADYKFWDGSWAAQENWGNWLELVSQQSYFFSDVTFAIQGSDLLNSNELKHFMISTTGCFTIQPAHYTVNIMRLGTLSCGKLMYRDDISIRFTWASSCLLVFSVCLESFRWHNVKLYCTAWVVCLYK